MWKWGRIIQDPVRWKHLEDVVDGLSPLLPHLKGLENGDHASSAIKQVWWHRSFTLI
jgi:hypothetical protein